MSDSRNILINFVGDVCLKNITDATYNYSQELFDIFSNADLNVANLECVLTKSNHKLPYQPIHLKGEPIRSKIFDCFQIFSMANNHTMDYGKEGLNDTLRFLQQSGKGCFGAGNNKIEALKPLVIDVRNIKIAFLAFNRFNVAKDNKAGTAPEDFYYLRNVIGQLKREGCFVIVIPHWNYQWIEYPAPDERKKGYDMIDSGADIIIGAHPHVVQGYEIYKGKYIYHSLGNFVFRDTKYTKTIPAFGKSFVLTIDLAPDMTYGVSITPTYTSNDGVRIMDIQEKTEFIHHLEDISNVLRDKKKSSRLFYQEGTIVSKNNKIVWGEVKKDGGYRAIIENYKIANWQDVKRKLYSMLFR